MDRSTSPFELPPVVMEPLKPEEFITKLQETIANVYMSSSKVFNKYMSKPIYRQGVNACIETNTIPGTEPGCYREVCVFHHTRPGDPIWAFIPLGYVMFMCNLATDDIYVRVAVDGAPWHVFDREVAVNRFELADILDNYF